jgi:hypothetical protein
VAHRLAVQQVIRSVATAVVVGVALLAAAPAQAAFPGANGKIAFYRYAGDGTDIFSVNPDGTNEVALTNQSGYELDPEWSPDGQKIAFGYRGAIRTMNADGSGQVQLLGPPGMVEPSWSPDGGKLAFARFWTPPPIDENPQQKDIFKINTDGTGFANVTNDAAFDSHPAWSPDGAKIAFDSGTCCPNDIYTINPDGTGLTQLTFDFTSDLPQWSPDGSKIAYSGYGGVKVMNRDGTGQTLIASGGAPAWSPDGKEIAFMRPNAQDPYSSDVWVMNADGSAPTKVAELAYFPNWQPLPTVSYEHPQSASSLQASLVPTFRPCGTGANPTNGQHSPPLGTQSCLPPVPGSNVARVGATSVGTASFTVVPGDTDPVNGDQADVTLSASISDVKTPGGADYVPNASGPDLTEITRLRLTDKANNYGGASGTATEYDFRVPLDCAATSDPNVGSTCSTSTSADSLLPGFVTEQRQTVVQAFRVRVDDAGANGTTGDSDDRIFATQGIYIS